MNDLEEMRSLMERATNKKLPLLSRGQRLADLGLESLDRIAIVVAVEERYGLEFTEAQAAAIRTIDDLLRFVRNGG